MFEAAARASDIVLQLQLKLGHHVVDGGVEGVPEGGESLWGVDETWNEGQHCFLHLLHFGWWDFV